MDQSGKKDHTCSCWYFEETEDDVFACWGELEDKVKFCAIVCSFQQVQKESHVYNDLPLLLITGN